MKTKPMENLRQSLKLAEEMIRFSQKGTAESLDDRCLTLYGIVHDCAFRIQAGAEKELKMHAGTTKKKGHGPEQADSSSKGPSEEDPEPNAR